MLAPCGIPSFSVGAIQSTERFVTSICRYWVLTQRLPPRATWSTVPTRSARSAAAWRPRLGRQREVLLQQRGPRLRQPCRLYDNEQTGTSERMCESLKDVVLGPAQRYEALRNKQASRIQGKLKPFSCTDPVTWLSRWPRGSGQGTMPECFAPRTEPISRPALGIHRRPRLASIGD